MIKFVCASCGERLSVPDQHGGRKGVCPTCQAVNRVPLKGFVETAPRQARPSSSSAPAPSSIEGETFPMDAGVVPAPVDPQSYSLEPVVALRERRIPKPLKIALLILSVLVLVGGLYAALLFALRALVPT